MKIAFKETAIKGSGIPNLSILIWIHQIFDPKYPIPKNQPTQKDSVLFAFFKTNKNHPIATIIMVQCDISENEKTDNEPDIVA